MPQEERDDVFRQGRRTDYPRTPWPYRRRRSHNASDANNGGTAAPTTGSSPSNTPQQQAEQQPVRFIEGASLPTGVGARRVTRIPLNRNGNGTLAAPFVTVQTSSSSGLTIDGGGDPRRRRRQRQEPTPGQLRQVVRRLVGGHTGGDGTNNIRLAIAGDSITSTSRSTTNNNDNNHIPNIQGGVARPTVVRINPLQPQVRPDSEQNLRTVEIQTQNDEDEDTSGLECGICFDYMREPVGCGGCTGRFCKSCFLRSLRTLTTSSHVVTASTCPNCRAEVAEPVPDLGLKQRIDSTMTVPCRWAGCPENQLALSQVATHETTCPFVSVSCQYRPFGCTWIGLRSELAGHVQNECQLHPVRGVLDRVRGIEVTHQIQMNNLRGEMHGMRMQMQQLRQQMARSEQHQQPQQGRSQQHGSSREQQHQHGRSQQQDQESAMIQALRAHFSSLPFSPTTIAGGVMLVCAQLSLRFPTKQSRLRFFSLSEPDTVKKRALLLCGLQVLPILNYTCYSACANDSNFEVVALIIVCAVLGPFTPPASTEYATGIARSIATVIVLLIISNSSHEWQCGAMLLVLTVLFPSFVWTRLGYPDEVPISGMDDCLCLSVFLYPRTGTDDLFGFMIRFCVLLVQLHVPRRPIVTQLLKALFPAVVSIAVLGDEFRKGLSWRWPWTLLSLIPVKLAVRCCRSVGQYFGHRLRVQCGEDHDDNGVGESSNPETEGAPTFSPLGMVVAVLWTTMLLLAYIHTCWLVRAFLYNSHHVDK